MVDRGAPYRFGPYLKEVLGKFAYGGPWRALSSEGVVYKNMGIDLALFS